MHTRLKNLLRTLGLLEPMLAFLRWKAYLPIRVANFLFQRIIGLNRECRFSVHFTSSVQIPERLHVHPSVYPSFTYSGGCYIQAGNGIEIDEGTLFAPGVKLISSNHDPRDLSQHLPAEPIRLGKNCWIGANAVILPGVQLGDRVIVGAGSVVTKSFPSDSVIAGVPAAPLKRSRDREPDEKVNTP